MFDCRGNNRTSVWMQIVIKEILCAVFGPKSHISVLSEFNMIKLLIIHSLKFLTHCVSLDNLEVSSGLAEIVEYHQHDNGN